MTDKKPSRKLEFIVAALVVGQEVDRRNIRANGAELPFSDSVNDYYLQHCGDFMNGFVIAFYTHYFGGKVVNKVAEFSERKWGQDSFLYKISDKVRNNDNLMNIISGVAGSVGVVFAEATGIINNPDPKDVPAGIAGALTYMAVRYYVTRKHMLKQEEAILQTSNVHSHY